MFGNGNARLTSAWTTHPDPIQRIEASRRNVGNLPRQPRDPQAYDAVMYPLRILTARDYIQDDYPYTATAAAEQFMERYPDDLDFLMAIGDAQRLLGPRPEALPDDFEKSDARRNLRDRIRLSRGQRMERLLETPEGVAAMAANLAHAQATYQSILEVDPGYTAAYRGLGEVYEARHEDRGSGATRLVNVVVLPSQVTLVKQKLVRSEAQVEESGDLEPHLTAAVAEQFRAARISRTASTRRATRQSFWPLGYRWTRSLLPECRSSRHLPACAR